MIRMKSMNAGAMLFLCGMILPAGRGWTASAPPREAVPHAVDLESFTVDGIGLGAGEAGVRRALGVPEEIRRIAPPQKEKLPKEKTDGKPRKRKITSPGTIEYAYFDEGIRILFDERTMQVNGIDCFFSNVEPYHEMTAAFSREVLFPARRERLLKIVASRVYKEDARAVHLMKDDRKPVREVATLRFSVEGWLEKLTFHREENLAIDIDELCVNGVCAGTSIDRAVKLLGTPPLLNTRGTRYIGRWPGRGLAVYARSAGNEIYRIAVSHRGFDGGFVQPLSLTTRKTRFSDYLGGRVYQEGSEWLCAYRKDRPLSHEKLFLRFDDDDRLEVLAIERVENIAIDLRKMSVGGWVAGSAPQEIPAHFGRFSKGSRKGGEIVLAYPRYGMRVYCTGKRDGGDEMIRPDNFDWKGVSRIDKVEIEIREHHGYYSVPVSLAARREEFEREAAAMIFRAKGNSLYLHPGGSAPKRGAVIFWSFDSAGWPRMVTFKAFHDILVDMRAFTVNGVGLGMAAHEVYRIFGRPDKTGQRDVAGARVVEYGEQGVSFAFSKEQSRVLKMEIDMARFEGGFVEGLTLDSDADEFEKKLYRRIYQRSGRSFFITRDGKEPPGDIAIVSFSITGSVESIVFLAEGMERGGLWEEITAELE